MMIRTIKPPSSCARTQEVVCDRTLRLVFLNPSLTQSRAATNETQLDADTGLPWCNKWGTRTGLPLRDQRDNPRKRLTWRDRAI